MRSRKNLKARKVVLKGNKARKVNLKRKLKQEIEQTRARTKGRQVKRNIREHFVLRTLSVSKVSSSIGLRPRRKAAELK